MNAADSEEESKEKDREKENDMERGDGDRNEEDDESIPPPLIDRMNCSDSEDEKVEKMRIPIKHLKMNQGFLKGVDDIFNEKQVNEKEDCVETSNLNGIDNKEVINRKISNKI